MLCNSFQLDVTVGVTLSLCCKYQKIKRIDKDLALVTFSTPFFELIQIRFPQSNKKLIDQALFLRKIQKVEHSTYAFWQSIKRDYL